MNEIESQRLAKEVQQERKRGPGRPVKVVEVQNVGISDLKSVEPAKVVGSLQPSKVVVHEPFIKAFPHKPYSDYSDWVKISPEEAEELGLAGKLLGHHPGLGIALIAK